MSRSEAEVAKAGHKFAFDFLRETVNYVNEKEGGSNAQNVLVSPFSMTSAFAMLANGAAGETRESIIKALGFEGLDIADVNSYYTKMFEALPEHDNTANIQFANCLFHYAERGELKHDFVSLLQNTYAADTFQVWNGPDWIPTINKWVEDKTNGCIKNMIPDLNVQYIGLFAISNAMYFDGKWTDKFDKSLTKVDAFNNGDGSISKAQFMNAKLKTIVWNDGDAKMINLGFGNGAYSVKFIIPEKGINMADYLASFDANKFNSLSQNGTYANLKLSLPKFEFSINGDWSDALYKCGLEDVFIGGDFSGITDERVESLYSLQTSSFQIDEEGAKASTASIVGNTYSSPGVIEYKDMTLTFDRPFMFVLMENTTNTILMTGIINKL